jgi:ABC-type sulfate/molybdate transport systems ATPase subunit
MTGRRLFIDVELASGPRVLLEAGAGITRIAGPSGVGKTSLLLAIAGIGQRARGLITFDDEVWLDSAARKRMPAERRGVGLVPQGAALFPHLDVAANVAYGLDRRRGPGAASLLAEVGAEHLARRRPATLSGGEAQRVALARALARGARVLLLDEPLSALDPAAAADLAALITTTTARHACITLLVTHAPFADEGGTTYALVGR